MIGATYQSKAIQAVLGTSHSSVIPATLWSGWLNGASAVLGMTGLTVAHSVFTPVSAGVANVSDIDGGVAPAGTIAFFALFDAATSGALVAAAAVTFDVAPAAGDPLTLLAGQLTFIYGEPA